MSRLVLKHVPLVLLLAMIVTVNGGCAGYHLGNQFIYRGDIRTVHVVMFESDSDRRFLGQRITEAVIKELEQKTPLTITDPQITDSYIRGRILRDTKQVVGENRFDEPRSIGVGWVVEVDWVDRVGTPLMQRQTVRISEDDVFIPEGGQSMVTAQQSLIERVARQIVSQMQSPW
ncbi:MAG: LPS assembly lipoprotein LptE [Planctomycetota bacterium]